MFIVSLNLQYIISYIHNNCEEWYNMTWTVYLKSWIFHYAKVLSQFPQQRSPKIDKPKKKHIVSRALSSQDKRTRKYCLLTKIHKKILTFAPKMSHP